MSFPEPEHHYDSSPYSAPGSMPTPEPSMPVAAPYDHQPQQCTFLITDHWFSPNAYPQPASYSSSSYPPAPAPAYPSNNGLLAAPPMAPYPQNTSSTFLANPAAGGYDPSRPTTPCSATTVVGSDHSHDGGHAPQPRAQSSSTQATTGGKPRPTKPPTKPRKAKDRDTEAYSSGCCIVM